MNERPGWLLPESECVPSPHRYFERRAPGYPERVTPTLLIIHYAVDGDQRRDDDEETDHNFLPRVRSDDCMDVARGFQKPRRQASTHFVVGRDGSKAQCVSLEDGCWGAGDDGLSRFPDDVPARIETVPFRKRFVNLCSVQIEECNVGYAVDKFGVPPEFRVRAKHPAHRTEREWEMFTDYQYGTTKLLVALIKMAYPSIVYACGHEDVTNRHTMGKVGGKTDPGPAWQWERLELEAHGIQRVRYDFNTRSFVLVSEEDTQPIDIRR